MTTNSNVTLQAGYTLTVSVSRDAAYVWRLDDPTVRGVPTPGSSVSFGPYMLARTFHVQDQGNATVSIAESYPVMADIPSTAQAAMLDAIPVEDATDTETVWNDDGVLKVSSAP